jgi:Uncharacterized protein conserved in bacteria (DUF2188)
MQNSQHVVPRHGQWAVRKGGASRATKLFESQADAIDFARDQAKKAQGVLYIHRFDGTVQRRDVFGPIGGASRVRP